MEAEVLAASGSRLKSREGSEVEAWRIEGRMSCLPEGVTGAIGMSSSEEASDSSEASRYPLRCQGILPLGN